MARKLVLSLVLLALTAPAFADQKILIPVYFNAAGKGSTWQTLLVINNGMSKPFSSSNLLFLTQCPIPEGCVLDSIPPGGFGTPSLDTSSRGLLLFAPDDEADNLVFRLVIGARPRNLQERGTEIPVVRERDLRTAAITLPYVELQGPVRVRLRVYDPDQRSDARVRVTLRPWNSPQAAPIATTELALQPPPGFFPVVPAPPTVPTYGELDLQAVFADVIPQGTYFNVEITPLTPGLRFWAFITITDNATNDVQTVTPQ